MDEFAKIVTDWLATARHPQFKKPYTELVYQPMLEVLAYLRANGFKTFIVSGGGIEFMRPWSERVYGIPPEQVVGSSIKTRFEMRDGQPRLFRLPQINFIDDKTGKPVGINEHIGRRPIAAFGNSDGDLQMLQWTTMRGSGAHFGLIVHHTDAEREYAYDRKSHVGKLDLALDAAAAEQVDLGRHEAGSATVSAPTNAIRIMLVAPGVPSGRPATMMTRRPALAKPSRKARRQARSIMSSWSRASSATTQCTPQQAESLRPAATLGEIATIGTCGRSRATRSAVEPEKVQQTMAERSSVSAICRAAAEIASAPVASGSACCACMMAR